jgi:hypothetical protein
MVSWLAKTTQLLQRRQPPEPPPPYEVGCSCGHQVTGVRKQTYQSVTCPRCGNVLFVLPLDVYPKPKPKKAPPKQVDSAPVVAAAAGPKAPQSQAAPASRAPGPQKVGQSTAAKATPASPPAPAVSEKPLAVDVETVEVRRPLVNRFRLIVLAIGAVVCGTGYLVWQSRLNDEALVSLPGHLDAGATALRKGELPKAADEYHQAAWAVDRLRRQDAESLAIRQKAKELGAIVNLSKVSLIEICDQARHAKKEGGEKWAEKWSEKFNEQYQGAWIVVEGDVAQERGPDGIGEPIVRFPYPIDAAAVVFDVRLTGLAPMIGKAGEHLIFAGQLLSLSREGTKNPMWVIRLKDETAFLWSNVDTYQALGRIPDVPGDENDGRHVLGRQSAALGLKP